MMENCKHCGNQIHDEPAGDGSTVWVDNSGGDICAVDGEDSPHVPFADDDVEVAITFSDGSEARWANVSVELVDLIVKIIGEPDTLKA
jgi:hypothetical protein